MAAQLRPALQDVAVVPMRRRHLRQTMAIERSVYPRPWSPSLFAAEVDRRDSRRYVVALARRGGWLRIRRRVVGYAGVLVQPGQQGLDAHVTTVAVHPAEHRRKVATRLLLAVLRAAIDLGAESATLEVRSTNRGAQRLYQAFGFAPVGVRPRYYAETGEDALIMWAHDLRSAAYADRLAEQEARLGQPGGSSGAPDHDVPWVRGRMALADGRPPTQEEG